MRKVTKFLSLALIVLVAFWTTHSTLASTVAPSTLKNHLAGDPGLKSSSVMITDQAGAVVYARNPEQIRSIASLTKLMTAMVVLDTKMDLEESIRISRDDRDLIKLTGSRLGFGASLSRGQLLHLALMASENRAATALGRTSEGGMTGFVAAMNAKAQSLGMKDTRFSDPAGLHPQNVSTARDLALMVAAAYDYPMIRRLSTATGLEVFPYPGRGPLQYVNTNRLLKNESWEIELSKTGYINESGRCLVMQAVIDGQLMNIVLLDSFGRLTPFGDSNRLRRWLRNA